MGQRKHEEFEIVDQNNGSRVKIIRLERYNTEGEDCFVDLNGINYPVLDFSEFGIAVLSDTEFVPSSEFHEVPFVYSNVEVSTIHIRLARQGFDEEKQKYIVAFEVIGQPIKVEIFKATQLTLKTIKDLENKNKEEEKIPLAVKNSVFSFKDWLEKLEIEINGLADNAPKNALSALSDYETTIIKLGAQYLSREFKKWFEVLEQPLNDLDQEQVKSCVEFFRSQLKNLLYQASFADRVYHKPLGYAGDFEMMNMIYRNESIGDTLFAKCLQNYYVNEPSAQAVRNRAFYLEKKVDEIVKSHQKENMSILSVASGPSREWQNIIAAEKNYSSRPLQVHLLDQDEGALIFSQKQIKSLGHQHPHNYQFSYLHQAIKNIIGRGLTTGPYDLIYSAGLFDYLSDPVAAYAAKKLFDSLNPGGVLILGNFNVTNPNRFTMDLALDWHLIYRNEDDLARLFGDLPGTSKVESEEQGINLFYVIRKD